MSNFTYVYILQSQSDPSKHYSGLTDDLRDRLRRHNAGMVAHTAKHTPWELRVAIAFKDRTRAAAFEAYLKSHSALLGSITGSITGALLGSITGVHYWGHYWGQVLTCVIA